MTSHISSLKTQQTLHLHNRAHRPMPSQPITHGVPWPVGEVTSTDQLQLLDENQKPLPATFTPLNTWPDGSLQWTLIDTTVDLDPSGNRALTACLKAKPTKPTLLKNPVTASTKAGLTTLSNGLASLTISAKPGQFVTTWTTNKKPFITPNAFDVTFKDASGKLYSIVQSKKKVSIEHASPSRTVVRIDGKHTADDGSTLLDYYLRLELRANRADVKITHAFRNREKPTPGISISDFLVTFPTTIEKDAKRCFTANTRTRHYLPDPMRVDEDPQIIASDTGDVDNYATSHKERANADCFVKNPEVLHDPIEEKPWWLRDIKFRLQAGGSKCVWPYLAILSKKSGALVSLEKFTSLHPKELTVSGSDFHLWLYPTWAGKLDITQGAGRSHTFYIAPLDPSIADTDIQSLYLSWEFGGIYTHVPSAQTIEICPDLNYLRHCKVFAMDLVPAFDPDARFLFERKIMDQWIGVSYGQLGAVDQVAPWPAAGFWHFGDQGGGNNEEMHNLVYFQNYLRTGNHGCFEYALNGTQHMMEVDHCAYSTDWLQTGGQVAHTTNHNNGTAYPSHEWFTEYLFAYVLTGDREYLETAKRTCEHLLTWINCDEGFRIIASDQREAGQPMINLTWCYHFTKDQRYLDACWKIIREYLMVNTAKYGKMLDAKPILNPVKVCSYGDYAASEGMFWLWQITRDESLKAFMLSQLQWRLELKNMGTHGGHRVTDYNCALYGYLLTGERSYIDRVSRPFKACFKSFRWPIGWVHSIYYIKAAFDLGLLNDDDIQIG